MTELESKIWDMTHRWCDAQYGEIPDQNRRYLMDEIKALVLSHVSGLLPPIDPLDDENSEIYKIGLEIAEMPDEEFEANCNAFEKLINKAKGNDGVAIDVSKRCFCGAKFDGIQCNSCGFDASDVDIY